MNNESDIAFEELRTVFVDSDGWPTSLQFYSCEYMRTARRDGRGSLSRPVLETRSALGVIDQFDRQRFPDERNIYRFNKSSILLWIKEHMRREFDELKPLGRFSGYKSINNEIPQLAEDFIYDEETSMLAEIVYNEVNEEYKRLFRVYGNTVSYENHTDCLMTLRHLLPDSYLRTVGLNPLSDRTFSVPIRSGISDEEYLHMLDL